MFHPRRPASTATQNACDALDQGTTLRGATPARANVALLSVALWLGGCVGLPSPPAPPGSDSASPPPSPTSADRHTHALLHLADPTLAQEAAIFALGLLDRRYRFGGANPESGLDCSGMVGWIYDQVAGLKLPRSAAQIAARTRALPRESLQPGDLVFFDSGSGPHSHMGIYAGGGRFIHAPSSRSKQVRVDSLDQGWFASRISGLRTLRP